MTPADRLPCPGSWTWGQQVFNNWKRVDQAPMDLREALIDSCDTVFYEVARTMWEREQATGAEREFLTDQAAGWGCASTHGSDLPNERGGVVPGRVGRRTFWENNRDTYCTKAEQLEPGTLAQEINADLCDGGGRWRGGDAINFSIGQGDLQTTPLQVANSFAAVANRGTLYRPHLAREVVHRDGTSEQVEPEPLATVPVDTGQLDYIEDGLRGVNEAGGTAAGAAGSQASVSQTSGMEAEEVDPIAEADVYMAYGRDAQAEEILKEALQKDPNRIPVHAKLLEIYAKRSDAQAFESSALKLKNLTAGGGPGTIGIIDRGPNPNTTKLWINWLLTQEGQTQRHLLALENPSPSLRNDVTEMGNTLPQERRQEGVQYQFLDQP
jgi:hypothetical protein